MISSSGGATSFENVSTMWRGVDQFKSKRNRVFVNKCIMSSCIQYSYTYLLTCTVEARSRGFYPKANDSKVARAPKNMPNNGFLN